MSGNIPPITQGLGKFTPDVWRRMSESIYETEESQGKRPPSRDDDQGIVTFPAQITGYNLINPSEQSFTNPSRFYYYRWSEVELKFTINDGVTVTVPTGARTSGTPGDDTFIPAINGSELGQPSDRNSSMLGVNLEGYPERVAVMPSVHRDDPVSGSGIVDTVHTTVGPIVMLSLLRCVVDEEPGTGNNRQHPIIGMFYSAIKFDGVCD